MKKLANILSVLLTVSLVFIACEKEEIMTEQETTPTTKVAFKTADACKKVDVYHTNGKLLSISINAAYTQIAKGGMLFSGDPDIGLDLTEIVTAVTPRIVAKGGDYTDPAQQSAEFELWYQETYCGVPAPGSEVDGGTLDGDAGSDL